MAELKPKACPDCEPEVSRRDFMKTSAGAAVAASLAAAPAIARAADDDASPEALSRQLFKSLTDEQRKHVAFRWNDRRRVEVKNNWRLVKPTVGKFYTKDQQALIRDTVRGLCSKEGYGRFSTVMKNDYRGIENFSVAMFGDPEKQYAWALAGRHLTMRCDGDDDKRLVFGGPVFYGHQASSSFNEKADHAGNVWWYQAIRANAFFNALDGKQRKQALLETSPSDKFGTVVLGKKAAEPRGISIATLPDDQKALARNTLAGMLSPFRASDVNEAMKSIDAAGGIDKLHFSFYKDEDIGSDGVWDNWMVQGPTIAWFFRGNPHVHTWVHVQNSV